MLILTIGIACVYAGQYLQMKGSSEQTADLIKAAKIQADAARNNAIAAARFAASADGINQQTKAAVDQFQRLAEATRKTAIAAKNAADIASRQLELQRPYVGVDRITAVEDKSKKGITLVIVLKNFGTVTAEGLEISYNWNNAMGVLGRFSFPLGGGHGVVFPGHERKLPATLGGKYPPGRCERLP